MSKRRKVSRSGSEKLFSATAVKIHPKNSLHALNSIMRGGIRL